MDFEEEVIHMVQHLIVSPEDELVAEFIEAPKSCTVISIVGRNFREFDDSKKDEVLNNVMAYLDEHPDIKDTLLAKWPITLLGLPDDELEKVLRAVKRAQEVQKQRTTEKGDEEIPEVFNEYLKNLK